MISILPNKSSLVVVNDDNQLITFPGLLPNNSTLRVSSNIQCKTRLFVRVSPFETIDQMLTLWDDLNTNWESVIGL